jgi:hypothetical protein
MNGDPTMDQQGRESAGVYAYSILEWVLQHVASIGGGLPRSYMVSVSQ